MEDNADGLVNAVSDLDRYEQVAFICEGVNLGRRKGSLSIATISYVMDVLKLGGERAILVNRNQVSAYPFIPLYNPL